MSTVEIRSRWTEGRVKALRRENFAGASIAVTKEESALSQGETRPFNTIDLNSDYKFTFINTSGVTVWRSRPISLGRNGVSYTLVSFRKQISQDRINSILPSKFEDGDETYSNLYIDIKDGKITIDGNYKNVNDFWFDNNTDVKYTFKLEPYYGTNVDIVYKGKTVDFDAEWEYDVLNAFTNFADNKVKPRIVSRISEEIYRIAEREMSSIPNFNWGNRCTITSTDIDINQDSISTNIIIGVPNELCPSSMSTKSGSLKFNDELFIRAKPELIVLNNAKERWVSSSSIGREVYRVFKKHRDEIFDIITKNPDIIKNNKEMISTFVEEYREKSDFKITEEVYSSIVGNLYSIQEESNEELSHDIEYVIEHVIPNIKGKKMSDIE